MRVYFITTVFVISRFAIVSHTFPVGDKHDAALYLQRFGYLDKPSDSRTGAILGTDAISNALKDFQRFAGLKQTGELDNDTITMMNKPRCGMKDRIEHSKSARKKRYVLEGSRWRSTRLTYRIVKYPTKIKNLTKVDREIARAFKVWSDVSVLTFEERKTGRVNIDISFESGDHGDADPFDGPGDVYAHAFYPKSGGDVHFDDQEKWTIGEGTGINLFQVAAHEFGHSLGLDHTNETGALMQEFYYGYDPNTKLHSDDIAAIRSLYATVNQPSPSGGSAGSFPDTSDASDLCQNGAIDAVTRTQNGSTYVFQGEFYWKILLNGLADGYPRKISDDWGGLEGNFDAAMTWSNGKTFFFKGEDYWRFTNKEMDSGYPKLIDEGFEGIPDMIDAALVWSGNGKTYFFKGDEYWKYDSDREPPVSNRYPRRISNWRGLPEDGIDAAFQWENGRTYFFKGGKYYKFNDINFEVESAEPPYPRSTSVWWFHCRAASQKTDSTNETLISAKNNDESASVRNRRMFGKG